MIPAARGALGARLLTGLSLAASLAVFGLYAAHALVLVRYPFDWSPDEGLSLDYGRRLLEDPATLYGHSAVPFPSAYGPLLPALLAPVVRVAAEPLAPARLLALGWTALGGLGVFLLVRQVAPPPLALASAALALAPFDLTFWYVLVRVDGLMVALWLLAAVPLLARWGAGAREPLSRRRINLASGLLLLASLAKATAAVHALPLVLARWRADRRSAWRLWATLGATAAVALALLQWSTDGGFVWVTGLWATHAVVPGLRRAILEHFGARAWPVVAVAGAALLVARGRRGALLADPALFLALGCALLVPAMSKFGASWNYALPALPAMAVVAGRWWGLASAPRGGPPRPSLAAVAGVLVSGVALVLALTRVFPLPGERDARTASALYGYVRSHVAASGGPILASRPDLAYFLAGQPVEIEGSSFPSLAAARVPGTEKVLARLERAEYTLVLEAWPLPRAGGYREALDRSYAHAGGCNLRYYLGAALPVHAFSRRDLHRPLVPPPGTDCGGPATPAATP